MGGADPHWPNMLSFTISLTIFFIPHIMLLCLKSTLEWIANLCQQLPFWFLAPRGCTLNRRPSHWGLSFNQRFHIWWYLWFLQPFPAVRHQCWPLYHCVRNDWGRETPEVVQLCWARLTHLVLILVIKRCTAAGAYIKASNHPWMMMAAYSISSFKPHLNQSNKHKHGWHVLVAPGPLHRRNVPNTQEKNVRVWICNQGCNTNWRGCRMLNKCTAN